MNDCGGKENFCKSFSTSTLLLNYPSSPGLLALLLYPYFSFTPYKVQVFLEGHNKFAKSSA
jgi:hypothetical protein